jgi:hypothetical protein
MRTKKREEMHKKLKFEPLSGSDDEPGGVRDNNVCIGDNWKRRQN